MNTTYPIKDIQEGKVAVVNDGTLEELNAVFKVTFPEDTAIPSGLNPYYLQSLIDNSLWEGAEVPDLPIQSIKVFMEELQSKEVQPSNNVNTGSPLNGSYHSNTSSHTGTHSSSTPTSYLINECMAECIAKSLYEDKFKEEVVNTPTPTTNGQPHYDNSKGSLYQFAEDHKLNAWEFDICKRVIRCRKKGCFKEDLEKTKFLIDLYLKEQGHLYENNKN